MTLLSLLGIEPADILANRACRLGERQRRRRRLRTLLGVLIYTWVAVLLLAEWAMSRANGGQWLVPELLGVLALALGLRFAVARLRNANPTVRCLSGPVGLERTRSGALFGGTAFWLTVAGERCKVPKSLRSSHKNWRKALSNQPYRVYVIGEGSDTVVGMEPAELPLDARPCGTRQIRPGG